MIKLPSKAVSEDEARRARSPCLYSGKDTDDRNPKGPGIPIAVLTCYRFRGQLL